jgi:hypothetical protein
MEKREFYCLYLFVEGYWRNENEGKKCAGQKSPGEQKEI